MLPTSIILVARLRACCRRTCSIETYEPRPAEISAKRALEVVKFPLEDPVNMLRVRALLSRPGSFDRRLDA